MKFELRRIDLESVVRALQNGLTKLSHDDNIVALRYKTDWHPDVTPSTGTWTKTRLATAKYCLNGKGARTDIALEIYGTVGAATPALLVVTLPDGVIGTNEGDLIHGWGRTNSSTPVGFNAFIDRTSMRIYQENPTSTWTGAIELRLNGSFERDLNLSSR